MDYSNRLKKYLELSYGEIEELNTTARSITDTAKAEEVHTAYLKNEPGIKAVTVCFSDIEGRLHMIDYAKRFLLDSLDNLTFDGSSVRGMSEQHESDLQLRVDWTSITFLPADLFGAGRVLVFANIYDQRNRPYQSDFRARLQQYAEKLKKGNNIDVYMAPEIEGFLLRDIDAEQNFDSRKGFTLVSSGGYYHSLPLDELRIFIDNAAEAMQAMGYRNEKDHPEVAPSQFELCYSYTDVVRAADQVQLYKIVCRQVAQNLGLTATFLPKPVADINGNGMHINFSLAKNGKNIFYDAKGRDGLSNEGWSIVDKLLNRANDLCLIFNSSVNAYRRLDPHFEAPNQIRASSSDRGSMIRIPIGSNKSARIEIRSVAPDANPYLVAYSILRTGLDDKSPKVDTTKRPRVRFLPDTIHDALRLFKASDYTSKLLGEVPKQKYANTKHLVANRSGSELGRNIKSAEVIYHHEVTNQALWSNF